MTDEPRKISEARLADAASGFDGFMSVGWIKSSGASVSHTLALWDQGQLAELPAVVSSPRPDSAVILDGEAVIVPVGKCD